MKLGAKMDGRKILIRAPRHGIESLGESRAYYTIELPTADHDDVWLIPVGDGDIARSGLSHHAYAYTNGGSLFVAAVDAAYEIASALGF
jgi:hypothetical protein